VRRRLTIPFYLLAAACAVQKPAEVKTVTAADVRTAPRKLPATISNPRHEGETFFLTVTVHQGSQVLTREVQVSEHDWLKWSLRTQTCVPEEFVSGASNAILDCQ
jgi:hypothetical protein